jgi:hypothetical protein
MTDVGARLHATLGGLYTIDRELGGGGMSRVFVATENALGRAVVIKIIAPDLLEGLSAERFTGEVKLAACCSRRTSFRCSAPAPPTAFLITRCRSWTASRCARD